MNYDDIFEAYYNLYRLEATTPASTDDEYTIGMRLANEAVNRWQHYDNTYWNELFTSLVASEEGTVVIASTTAYDAPTDMQEAGGFVKVLDASNNVVQSYPILEPNEAQFKDTGSTFAYFTGDPTNGFVLNINPTPTSPLVGLRLDYIYYKQPTFFTTGTDVNEMADPYFIVNRMLANRFRGSRNPYYSSAMRDAENALRQMQLVNNSGSWANPWQLADNSGAQFGQSLGAM